jgi:protein-disulfide isomerase
MVSPPRLPPLLVPDEATDHVLGPSTAAVIVTEYGDFECPSCGQAHGAMKILQRHFAGRIRFVFRHYPLVEPHPHAEIAAEAAEASGAQGKFWPYYDLLFEHQDHLKPADLRRHAEHLQLDLGRFDFEMSDHVYLQRVQEHMISGRRLGVRATPAFYVNGAVVDVSFGLERLHQAIDRALATK